MKKPLDKDATVVCPDKSSDNYNKPYFAEERKKDGEDTEEMPKVSKEMERLAGYLNGDFPQELVDKYGFFAEGGMIQDAWDAYQQGDYVSMNRYINQFYRYLEKKEMSAPAELECWIEKMIRGRCSKVLDEESNSTEDRYDIENDIIIEEDGGE